MPFKTLQWPSSVYPGEVKSECPEAMAVIDVLLLKMQIAGPSPQGYHVKNLGKKMGGLWQINLKVEKKQIRVLYAPYKGKVVLFRIHKKTSPQEQERAYGLAIQRKNEYEIFQKQLEQSEGRGGSRTLH